MKNITIMGGLLVVAAVGAGRWSLDGWSSQKGEERVGLHEELVQSHSR